MAYKSYLNKAVFKREKDLLCFILLIELENKKYTPNIDC